MLENERIFAKFRFDPAENELLKVVILSPEVGSAMMQQGSESDVGVECAARGLARLHRSAAPPPRGDRASPDVSRAELMIQEVDR